MGRVVSMSDIENKYVKLKHVKELLGLIKIRDSYYDWSDNYEKYDNKVKNTVEWLERNAKTLDKPIKFNQKEEFYEVTNYEPVELSK